MSKNGIKYFLVSEGPQGVQPRIIWDPDNSNVAACAHPNGVFAVTGKRAAQLLAGGGYREVTAKELEAMRLKAPEPDILDWSLKEHRPKYAPYE
jgi:hypothetical protein